MPVDFYEEAMALLGRANRSGVRADAAADGPKAKHLHPRRVGGVVPQPDGAVLGTSRQEGSCRGERQAVDVAGVTLPGRLLPGFQVPAVYGGLRLGASSGPVPGCLPRVRGRNLPTLWRFLIAVSMLYSPG